MPFYTRCGSSHATEDRFCASCGHGVKPETRDQPPQASKANTSDVDEVGTHPRAANVSGTGQALSCPKCGLLSPAGVTSCDCGYEFSTGEIATSKALIAATPSGVGGWLALLTFGLLCLGPLIGAGRINVDFTTAENQNPALKTVNEWANFKAATWSAFLGFSVVSAYAGWGLMRGRRWSVVQRARISLWVIGPVANVVLGLLVPFATLRSAQGFEADELVVPFIGAFISSLIFAAVWTAYLSKSRRVRTTYGIVAEIGGRHSSAA